MFTIKNKRIPLLRYWTARYLITLFAGIIVIGLISSLWIKHSAAQKRLDSIRSLAQEVAEGSVDVYGNLFIDPRLAGDIDRRQRFLSLGPDLLLFVVDDEGRIVYSRPGIPSPQLLRSITIPSDQEEGVQQLNADPQAKLYIIKQAVKNDQNTIGSIFVVYPHREVNRNPEEIQLLVLMLSGIAFLGWIIIYTLTRKLSKPVQDVAEAAKQIVTGNYDVKLDSNVKEREIYELIESFKDMVARLRQLEALRTELLAGVTHELKTPVASISGLIQAVKDGVVSGDQAREFLEIGSRETARLQKMVEDLLDFNSLATGDIKVEKNNYNLNQLVKEIAHQWMIAREDTRVALEVRVPEEDIILNTDALRLQQILYNLLNNAQQAFPENGNIEISLAPAGDGIRIDVKDDGPGIPTDEQPFIFERFFRGQDKKLKLHGLGLGLSFSRMIARALGGDLVLASSCAGHTTFTLTLGGERDVRV